MFNQTRTISNWRCLTVLAGLLTLMATGVASATPRHGPPALRQCATCVAVGAAKCDVHAQGHDGRDMYRRGYAAGNQSGWQAGYSAGLNGCRAGRFAKQRLKGRHVQYQVGFRAGYAEAYAQGYRQGRAESRPVLRFSWRW